MGYANTAEKLTSPVPDYLDAFHLSHDPFEISPADDLVFYPGGQREAILDQVAHLSQFSASVVVVAGESGSGRTTLKDMLQIQLHDRYLIADIDAAEAGTPQQIFAEIAAVLGYEVSAEASPGELMSAIRSGLHHLRHENNDRVLLLLDDAHWLSDAVLSALLSLLQAAEPEQELPFQMVLFGDLDLIDRLDGFGMVDVLLHDVLLPPFTEDEMAEYLAFRLEAAGWDDDLPFTDAEVGRLHGLAQGLPGAVHQPARELLIDKATLEPAVSSVAVSPAAGLPVAHIFSLVVLVGVLLMAFFYRDSWLGPDEEAVAGGANPGSSTAVTAARPGGVPATDRQGNDRSGTAIRLPIGQESATAVAPVTTPPATSSPSTVAGGQRSIPASTPVTSVVADTEFTAAVPDTVVEPEASAPATPPVTASTPAASPTASVPVAPAAPVTPTTPIASPAVTPAAPSGSAAAADERHLLALPGHHYVLQVMASGSKPAVDGYLQGQNNRSSLFLYTSLRDGKPWFVVVTGNYSSLEMARAGIESLPPAQKKAGPWPRKISDVQLQIKEFRDK